MNRTATTVDGYLSALSPERREIISGLRDVVVKHLPAGYMESIGFGMISYCVPLSRLPDTYNKQPLCYAAIAAQKNHNAIYLMGVYSDVATAQRFKSAFVEAGKKLDMGQSCVRFKTLDDLPLDVIGETIAAVPMNDYIAFYERSRLQTKEGQRRAEKSSAKRAPAAKRSTAKKAPATKATAKNSPAKKSPTTKVARKKSR